MMMALSTPTSPPPKKTTYIVTASFTSYDGFTSIMAWEMQSLGSILLHEYMHIGALVIPPLAWA